MSFTLGQTYKDFDCRLTNSPCGKNMVFVPYMLFYTWGISSFRTNCVQRCSCITDHGYKEINGQCIYKTTEIAKNAKMSTIVIF